MMTNNYLRGKSSPLGATPYDHGVNFCVYSNSATAVQLLLFESEGAPKPSLQIDFDPKRNRTGSYWHIFVPDLHPGQLYGYRVHGPFDPTRGHRFDPQKVLLDPYGRCVAVGNYSRAEASRAGDNAATAMKSVVTESRSYDWEGDASPCRPFSQTVVYEMHVGGFTKHPSSRIAPEKRGTFAGVVEKIPHLLALGITAVELLPIFQFDEQDAPPGLSNYWGYSPVSFFAPHAAYSSRPDPLGCLVEFKDMVKALHRAGIEVILDVVYNHTAEGSEYGPTLCYRGFENETYYLAPPGDKSRYANYAGCGNTLNTNHRVVRRMILDSVRYWVSTMHVDGLRFDLASILSRDESGRSVADAPILADLESDPALADTKLIAEAWDTELYQLGAFAGGNWKEWNGKFRDQLRAFMKADRGSVRGLADRLLGSPDLYGAQGHAAEQSVNFVTCHDGFTLNDLVSYEQKHNENNGEGNRDGTSNNLSWNCGVEGPTEDPAVELLRNRQVKNFLALTLLSEGTAMILMGDEARRTQRGNNNAYCQNNEISWFDWGLTHKHADIFRFVQQLIRLRFSFAASQENEQLSLTEFLQHAEIHWHGVCLDQPDWSDDSHSLAVTLRSYNGKRLSHLLINAYWQPLEFQIPSPVAGNPWWRFMDTALKPPLDIADPMGMSPVVKSSYTAQPHSVVLLFSEMKGQPGLGSWRNL